MFTTRTTFETTYDIPAVYHTGISPKLTSGALITAVALAALAVVGLASLNAFSFPAYAKPVMWSVLAAGVVVFPVTSGLLVVHFLRKYELFTKLNSLDPAQRTFGGVENPHGYLEKHSAPSISHELGEGVIGMLTGPLNRDMYSRSAEYSINQIHLFSSESAAKRHGKRLADQARLR